jgi:hypothetical protein
MRWIKQHEDGTIERGEAAPPTGCLFFVDQSGSWAFIEGVLYKDGKRTFPGQYEFTMENGVVMIFMVGENGIVIEEGGGEVG